MFSPDLLTEATNILALARAKSLMIATAESCTGGLIVACLTEIAGSSDVVDCGFVTYSNDAKTHMIGVSPALLEMHGAVSAPVAEAMAQGALDQSRASVSVAVTGIAGPDGGSAEKPVGLVHIAGQNRHGELVSERFLFGDSSRNHIRLETVKAALAILRRLVINTPDRNHNL
ncbi:CinA family protein [Govanella unica]|uniref:CinA family protein n=1 Tax=Govanella unica TaxID=2975056 RepID=A0A9X3TYC7_9PROT|nr:CinA family protein [Govania unica]MDA5193809.1 CinA family protein [Govania unica]